MEKAAVRGRRAIRPVSPGNDGALLDRGVWQLPVLGPKGEPVLVAVDAGHRMVMSPVYVPSGVSLVDIADDLGDFLDRADPVQEVTALRLLG